MKLSSNVSRAGILFSGAFLTLTSLTFHACTDPLGVRDTLQRSLTGDDFESKVSISEDGAVLARGPVRFVAERSFGISVLTFTVSDDTEIIDAGGSVLKVSDLSVGLRLEVDGQRLDDGTVDATFVEEIASSAEMDGGENEEEGEPEDEDDGNEEVQVVICHIPPGNPENARTKSVGSGAAAVHLAHGDTAGECPESTEASGDDEETREGEEAEDDDDDEEEVKVEICHIPPGNPDNARTLNVDEDEVGEHLDHGDHEGPCTEESGSGDPVSTDDDDDDEDEVKVEICHIPPGNPDNARTLNVDEDEVGEHLDHGDHEGPCTDTSGQSGSSGSRDSDDADDDDDGDDPDDDDDGDDPDDGDDDDDGEAEQATICHLPGGDPDKAETKQVDADDVQEHLEHGDYEGPCTG